MRFVEQDRKVTTDHTSDNGNLGKIEITVECPEYESLDEFANACGGVEKALNFVNGQVGTSAKNAARALLRNYEVKEGTTEDQFASIIAELEEKAQNASKNYSPAAEAQRGPSVKKKAATLDEIGALMAADELTTEKLAELLAKVQ